MDANEGIIARETVARADQLSQRKIFWTMIATVVVVIAGMINGMIR